MKKTFTLLLLALVCVTTYGQRKIQGIPYDGPKLLSATDPVSSGDSSADGTFTFDMIKNWSGTGANRAAMVLQFNDSREEYALVFGYRFDGTSTGLEMMETIVKNNPRLYWLTQSGTAYGSTFAAMGWDADNDGDIALMKNGVIYELEEDWNVFYTTSSDYDSWTAVDNDDYWRAGWYSNGYWSYWVKSSAEATFSYSSYGISGRTITDGCWDGWNFAAGFMSSAWKTFAAAPAAEAATYPTAFNNDGISYKLKNRRLNTVVVTAPTEVNGVTPATYSGDVKIPASFEADGTTYTVVGVADEAFAASNVTSVTLPDGATSIGTGIFKDAASLTAATLPAGITALPASTFEGTAITAFSLEGYTAVGDAAFKNSALAAIEVPGSVTTIGSEAFNTSSLTGKVKSLKLSPVAISDDVFSEQTYNSATLVVADGYESVYAAADGWKNFVQKSSEYIETAVGDVFPYDGAAYEITTNATATDRGKLKVTYFPVDTYSAANVKAANKVGYTGDVTIPAVVKYQGKEFDVVAVGDSAFIGATALTKVVLPNTIEALGAHMADGCLALTACDISAVESAVVPDYAFYNCQKLEAITFPKGVETIGRDAYYGCYAAADITIPATVTTISDYAFDYCKTITTVTVPATVTSVGTYAFANCTSLTTATVEGAMGESMFRSCSALTTATLPAGTTTLKNAMFYGCKALTNINVWDDITTVEGSALYNCTSLAKTLPSKLDTAGSSAFYGCTGLTGEIPATVTSLGNSAFRGCTGLTGMVEIPASVTATTMPTYLFYGCTGITDIVVPATMTTSASNFCNSASALNNLWLCATDKAVALTNRTYLQKASNKYPTIKVPYGMKGSYTAIANYKNYYTVEEIDPTVSSVKNVTKGNTSTVTFAITPEVAFPDGLPKQMADACDTSFATAKQMLQYREKNSGSVYATTTAVPTDGTYYSTVEDLDRSKTYEYRLAIKTGDGYIYTEAGTLLPTYDVIATSADETKGTVAVTLNGETVTEPVEKNSVVTATATPLDGCIFVNWTDADGKQLADTEAYDITVVSDVTIVANFLYTKGLADAIDNANDTKDNLLPVVEDKDLVNAIDAAQAVLDNARSYTQEEIDAATATLDAAVVDMLECQQQLVDAGILAAARLALETKVAIAKGIATLLGEENVPAIVAELPCAEDVCHSYSAYLPDFAGEMEHLAVAMVPYAADVCAALIEKILDAKCLLKSISGDDADNLAKAAANAETVAENEESLADDYYNAYSELAEAYAAAGGTTGLNAVGESFKRDGKYIENGKIVIVNGSHKFSASGKVLK